MESSIPSSDRLNQICIRYMRSMTEFFSNIELGVDTFKTINGNEFTVTSVDDKHINISIPGNATVNKLTLSLDEVRKMLESGQKFDKIKDVTTFFGKSYDRQKVIEQNKKNAVRHAYFREYLALQRLAYMFRFDAKGTQLNFEAMAETVACYRMTGAVPAEPMEEIRKDMKKRGGRK